MHGSSKNMHIRISNAPFKWGDMCVWLCDFSFVPRIEHIKFDAVRNVLISTHQLRTFALAAAPNEIEKNRYATMAFHSWLPPRLIIIKLLKTTPMHYNNYNNNNIAKRRTTSHFHIIIIILLIHKNSNDIIKECDWCKNRKPNSCLKMVAPPMNNKVIRI